jgi:hypothetical protein
MNSAAGTFFDGMSGRHNRQAERFRIYRQKERAVVTFSFWRGGRPRVFRISETRPRSRLRKMFSRQRDPDANDHARQKTDEETKPGRVAHRALSQVEYPRRFIFVHGSNLNRARQSASRRSDSSGKTPYFDDLGGAANRGLTSKGWFGHLLLRDQLLRVRP